MKIENMHPLITEHHKERYRIDTKCQPSHMKRRANETRWGVLPINGKHLKSKWCKHIEVENLEPYSSAKTNSCLNLKQPLNARAAYMDNWVPHPNMHHPSKHVQTQP